MTSSKEAALPTRRAPGGPSLRRLLDGASRISPRLVAAIDWTHPGNLGSWKGPLNGQAQRQRIVRDIAVAMAPRRVIETGTYRGASTEYLANVASAPVFTVEANARLFYYCQRRFRARSGVTTLLGDSRTVLAELAKQESDGATLFYLDAHWEQDLPLADELRLIEAHWADPVVIVDDFEVPGRPGYTFDDYGEGKRIGPDYVRRVVSKLRVLVPTTAPEDERASPAVGYGVLAYPDRVDQLTHHGLVPLD